MVYGFKYSTLSYSSIDHNFVFLASNSFSLRSHNSDFRQKISNSSGLISLAFGLSLHVLRYTLFSRPGDVMSVPFKSH